MEQTNTPKKGCILVSKPLINDGFFEQSVVYLTAHDAEGSLGFTLNKVSSLIAQDFIDEFSGRDTIFYGGPVEQDALFYLHGYDKLPGAVEVGNSLYLGGDFELFKVLYAEQKELSMPLPQPKFFLGYSGWSPGQLEEELKGDTWIVLEPPFNIDPLTATSDAWRTLMKQMGGKYALWANAPSDPLLN